MNNYSVGQFKVTENMASALYSKGVAITIICDADQVGLTVHYDNVTDIKFGSLRSYYENYWEMPRVALDYFIEAKGS